MTMMGSELGKEWCTFCTLGIRVHADQYPEEWKRSGWLQHDSLKDD